MKFPELSINEFSEKLASKSPTPGGGSTAGLSAALSASLLHMVIELTKKDDCELHEYRRELERISDEAQELIDEDAESFNQVMAAYKMPKETADEKKERSKKIQHALREASIIPLKTMKLGMRLLEIAQRVIQLGNPNAISDVGVAGLMALSAVKGGSYNVLINISSLEDKECAESLGNNVKEILTNSEIIAQEIESITETKVKK